MLLSKWMSNIIIFRQMSLFWYGPYLHVVSLSYVVTRDIVLWVTASALPLQGWAAIRIGGG